MPCPWQLHKTPVLLGRGGRLRQLPGGGALHDPILGVVERQEREVHALQLCTKRAKHLHQSVRSAQAHVVAPAEASGLAPTVRPGSPLVLLTDPCEVLASVWVDGT
eukprot:CAMPEP_0194729116 /NCGR_PEP_ID=MMETSP0296-20130528/44902_1 /TAXON_ID=39354 /ORGANISM="Heterosigma akashiwo, Strain CCMP2393" /LENGTH=105 /DNA_ID=CAMNT_0039635455 /DNA_START=119 /DNA_END=432 /DNA_ORIENTATION=-